MKRTIILLSIVVLTFGSAVAQEISSRAKALRMMHFTRPEYMIKDIKILADTMTLYTLSEHVIYPFGKWNSIEQYITSGQLRWERKIGYKQFYDSMNVSVNTLERIDGSHIDVYRSIWTGLMEILGAKITDPEIVYDNGLHTGMSKQDVFNVFFDSHPQSYTSDIHVLKVVSAANEVSQIYTFKGRKLRHIEVVSRYKYY